MTALDMSFDPASFSGRVPLFPLPGTVLLPGGVLPLHVFEPRYRAMVGDALAGERFIAMALLRPGYEEEYDACPAIEPAVCVGRVALEQELPDGRWNLVLLGLCRARVLDEDRTRAYRVASVELLTDAPLSDDEEERQATGLVERLRAAPPRLVRDRGRLETALELLTPGRAELPMGLRLDLCADQFHLSPGERQRLLETAGVAARADLLVALLEQRAAEIARLGLRPAWPPPASPY